MAGKSRRCKALTILLCLAMTLCCASALAEGVEKEYIGTISMNGAFEKAAFFSF